MKSKYAIQKDPHCWALCKWQSNAKNPDREGYVAFKWYGTLQQAICGLLDHCQRENCPSGALDTQTVLEALQRSHDEVLAVVQQMTVKA